MDWTEPDQGVTHLTAYHPLYQGLVEDYGPFVQALIVHTPENSMYKSVLLYRKDWEDAELAAKKRVEGWWRVL